MNDDKTCSPQQGGDHQCQELPTTTPPADYKPPDCPAPPSCNCPDTPGVTESCLETLIAEQAEQISMAEKAKAFKAELEAFLAKATAASGEYTQSAYDDLVVRWQKQDGEILKLLRDVECKVPCWRCVIECYLCPLLNDLRMAEQKLIGDGNLYTDVHSIYDLRYWHERDRDTKERTLLRIKETLAAWEKPKATIDKALSDVDKLLTDCKKSLSADPSRTVYDVFFKLLPTHLAIAPPKSDVTWQIDDTYSVFCECDTGKPDDCCGPDVGELSLRRRLIGQLPYLVKPNSYFELICCLVQHRYQPAKDAFAKAAADYEKVDNEINRYKDQVLNGLKDFEKNAKAKLPSDITCCDDKLKAGDSKPTQGDKPTQVEGN